MGMEMLPFTKQDPPCDFNTEKSSHEKIYSTPVCNLAAGFAAVH